MLEIINMNMPEVKIFTSRALMGRAAAQQVATKLKELLTFKNLVNVVFAAAPSQNEFLAALIEQDVDWTRVNGFHMDEYIGLDPEAPQGFGNFLKDRLFSKLPFNEVHYLNGNETDTLDECKRYTDLLAEFQIDIVCMGIGENGHIAFNDPPVADFHDSKMVKVVDLELACRQQQVNDGCFVALEEVPLHALTLTIPALMKANFLYIIVPGELKATAVYNTLHKPITEAHPSTILRTHENGVLFLDGDSSKLL
jgi:glucosamine-6-phosphate deaminase